jgi:hypothetical protein
VPRSGVRVGLKEKGDWIRHISRQTGHCVGTLTTYMILKWGTTTTLFAPNTCHHTPWLKPGACISPARSADTLPSCLTRPYLPRADAPNGKEDTGESRIQGVDPHAEPCMSDSPTDRGNHLSPTVSHSKPEECLCAGLSTDLFLRSLSKVEMGLPGKAAVFSSPRMHAEVSENGGIDEVRKIDVCEIQTRSKHAAVCCLLSRR